MRKFLTLTLALLLALSIAAPAMAFTSTAPGNDGDIPFELDIYLVDYEDNDFFGFVSLPESDRGYAKNEVVAAVAELFVPEDEDPADDDYGYNSIEFSGDNVSLNVTDNDISGAPGNQLMSNFGHNNEDTFRYSSGELTRKVEENDFGSSSDDETYKWLFFAKVTGDDATLTFALRTTEHWNNCWEQDDTLEVGDYIVEKDADGDGHVYIISEDGVDLLRILVDKKYKSTGLEILLGDEDYTVVGLKNDKIGFIGDDGLLDEDDDEDEDIIDDLMDIFTDVFEDDFGFDFDLLGNVVDDDFFLDYVGTDDIEVTVEINPWTAYVSIPDVVVIDPPKTGDAASILGFVMVALAAVAAFAVKKVRA